MSEGAVDSGSTLEALMGHVEPRTLIGTTSYYLASTLIFFLIIQFFNDRKQLLRMLKLGKVERVRQNSGNNNTSGKDGQQSFVGGLDDLPGPKSLPILGNMLDMCPLSKTIDAVINWGKIYGPVFRIYGPGEVPIVILNSGPEVQKLLKSTDLGHITKLPYIYDLMKPFINNGVLVSKGKFWQHERKILLRSMSFQSLRAYITMLNNHCENFVDSLNKLFADGGVHTINELLNSSFLEVICEMITGFDIHNNSEGVEYHHNFQIWKESISHRLINPWNILNPIWKLNPLSWKTNKAINDLSDFARRRIAEHRKRSAIKEAEAAKKKEEGNDSANSGDSDASSDTSTPKFRSVLDELIDAGVSEEQMVDEVNTMLFGGHETGASTIHLFCFAMALNPEIQELARREVDELFEDPMQLKNGRMTYESVTNLKYLERCILETLRLYPPAFIFLRELQTPLQVEVDDKPIELPAGCNIGIFPFGIHRKEEYFPDPERFDPDRFLPEEASKRHAYSYLPFSSGPRNCLGLKFAMIEMKMMTAYMLRNFVLYTTDKLEDVKLLPNLTLTPERDYNFIFKRRTIS